MPEDPEPRRSIRRRWLSIFFVVHWWAVLAYVVPSTRAGIEPLPDWLEPAVAVVAPRAVRWTSVVTVPYLDLTATRQHWTLFAPDPAGWVQSLRVVPYFPTDEDSVWVADTLTFQGPRELEHPHVLNHRTFRLFYNMGYVDWGAAYRGHFAREMCRTLRDRAGGAPDGVEFFADWYPMWAPWVEPWYDEDVYRQRLGGWDCRDEARVEPGTLWWAYGLPDPVPTEGWRRVAWPPPEGMDPGSEPPGREGTPPDSVVHGEGAVR